jgi:hypothetical protein
MAHLCPDPSLFDMLNGATTDKPAAAIDATTLTPAEAVTRFTESAEILRATPMSKKTVIAYPIVGSTTLAVVADVALMEAPRSHSTSPMPSAVPAIR